MKRFWLMIVILTVAFQGMAQNGGHAKMHRKEAVAIGLKIGGGLAKYAYAGSMEKDTLAFDSFVRRLRPLVGVNVEIPIGGVLYIAPEVTLVGRGDSRLFESSLWDTLVRNFVWTNYLEFRLPIAVAIPASDKVKPYVFVSPSVGLTLPLGQITQYSLDTVPLLSNAVAIDSSNMSLYDIGVMVGAGARFMFDFTSFSLVVKLEAGYHFGFRDTYSPMEHNDQAPAANVNAYNIYGTRMNRGFEASVTVSLPLKFYRDACYFGSRIY